VIEKQKWSFSFGIDLGEEGMEDGIETNSICWGQRWEKRNLENVKGHLFG
jgi:hypothetical protein